MFSAIAIGTSSQSAACTTQGPQVIIHIVSFKFLDGITWSDPRAPAAEHLTLSHPRHIKEILRWIAGRNISSRQDAYNFGVIGYFADHDALIQYQLHPHHQQGVKAWRELSTWVVIDMEVKYHDDPDKAYPSQMPSWV